MAKRNTKKEKLKRNKGFPYKSRVGSNVNNKGFPYKSRVGSNVNTKKKYLVVDEQGKVVDKFRLFFTARHRVNSWRKHYGFPVKLVVEEE